MSIVRRRSRVSRPLIAGMLCAAFIFTMGMIKAGPAFAYTNICQDSTLTGNVPVRAAPDGNSRIEEWVGQGNPENNAGYAGVVCQFFNNVSQGTWWMPVRTWWSGNGVGGYIWVQHLYWGHTHHCWTLFASYQAIPSGYCFLTSY